MSPTQSRVSARRTGDQGQALLAQLREAIVSGELSPGQLLRQDVIADRYNTSRMPVREALRLLETEKLVRLVPNKGASVAPLDVRELQEVNEMRVSAESLALRLALPEISNAQLDRAQAIQDKILIADPTQFGTLNREFHGALYQPCDRPRLLAHVAGLNDTADRYLRFTIERLDYSAQSNDEHDELLAACRRRDQKQALDCLSEHIMQASNALLAYLDDKLQDYLGRTSATAKSSE